LWEQGKFGLDDPLSRYLPEFADMKVYAGPRASPVPPGRRPITVRDLMRHTAGLVRQPPLPADDAFRASTRWR
jgi:CubicO group peptidase (beta-lactamase class C family)